MTEIVSDIKAKMLEVTRMMNQASQQGIRIEFSISPDSSGEYSLKFKALQEMKLD